MNSNILLEQKGILSDAVLKVTALVYLKDAIVLQQYENCPELVGYAKGFGAQQGEIDAVIASCLLRGKPGGQKGGGRGKNRLGLI